MLKRNLFIAFLCLVSALSTANPVGVLKHFSHDDQLSQSRILDIKQDEQGFMWLSTFNGLIRYDGSNFRNFKVSHGDSLKLRSNRVSRFEFDKNGRIWIQSERNDIYYFELGSLSFHHPFEGSSQYSTNFKIDRFSITSSGRVWLFPSEGGSLIYVEDGKQIHQVILNEEKALGDFVTDVFEDTSGTTWILTTRGICRMRGDDDELSYYFFNKVVLTGNSYSFNTVLETEDELWFGGAGGVISRYEKQSSTFFEFQPNIEGDIIRMELAEDSTILIVTRNHGFYHYNPKTGKLESYNSKTLPGFPRENIQFMAFSNFRYLWFQSSAKGVFRFDLFTHKLKYLFEESQDLSTQGVDRKTFLITSPDGTIWVQTGGGPLAYWDEKEDKLYSIAHCFVKGGMDVSDVMHTAKFDHQGNLWFCSHRQGLDLLVFNSSEFKSLNLTSSNKSKKHSVRSIMEDDGGNIWVASRLQKITIISPEKKVIGQLGADGALSDQSPEWGADIYNMMQDSAGRIWIGTRGNGLFCLYPDDIPFRYNVKHFVYNDKDRYSISSNDIYKIFQASDGKIYLGTWGGGLNIVQPIDDGFKFISFRNELEHYPMDKADRVRSIAEDMEHNLYFISPYELYSFEGGNVAAKKLSFTVHPEVSGNDMLDLLVTKDNWLALGTNGKGVVLADLNGRERLSVKSSGNDALVIPVEGILALQDDDLGRIWGVADKQVVRYDPKGNTIETFPEIASLVANEIFSEATKCKLSNGEIIIGHSNGAIYFNPELIKPFDFQPFLSISDFTVLNRDLHEVNPESPSNYDMLDEIVFKHNQNFFRIFVSAVDYVKRENIIYRYQLEGVEDQWNYFKGAQSINYTNLGRGDYTLLISSTNSHNLWVDNERRIKVTILPSIWETNFAYFCYALLILGLFWFVQRTIVTILKLRSDVEMQKQLAELKLKFFTDISHEIRTPLTMITAPVEKLLSDKSTPGFVKNQLQTIERNSNRLLGLVNQILDLRRIQNRKLEVSEIDLSKYLLKVCENFREMSLFRKIRLDLKINASAPIVWVDADSLEKILVNLLSNAFKYCESGDSIEIVVDENDGEIVILVRDNGPGISQEIQKRLFVRFSSYNEDPNKPSTGIGLSIVKDLAEKHGASVLVESELGKGSCFKVFFPKGYNHFDEDIDIHFQENEEELPESTVSEEGAVSSTKENLSNGKKTGLIVEDDSELRHFIVSILEADYNVHQAENGMEGHLKAIKLAPDFIISDIMMPQLDGIDMLKLIRNNIQTSHIPVVLLTAKTSIESRLEGMEYGADEYLTKPFNVSYLKARVKNILEQRKRLQLVYSSGNTEEIPIGEPLQISNQDHKFMLGVIAVVKENIMKTDFSVEELGKLMGMSRASFFNKLKGISGMSPVEFIRDIRMNKAAELLKKEDLLIKEISFEVGFSDLKYFGKCFKAKFNFTPAEYRRHYR